MLGMAFGVTQMILYLVYRKRRNNEILPVTVVDPKHREEANNNNGIHMNMIIAGTADPRCNDHHHHDNSNGDQVEIEAIETNQLNVTV